MIFLVNVNNLKRRRIKKHMNKKYLIPLVVSMMAAILAIGYFAGQGSMLSIQAPQDLGYTGYVTVAVKRAGESEFTTIFEGHNLVVTQGLQRVRDFFGWYNHSGTTNANCTKWISLSTSASAASAAWTVIPSEITTGGLERAGDTPTFVNETAFQVVKTFTASATHTDVQLTGLNTAVTSNSNTLWAAISFTATKVTLSSGDSIQITWTVCAASG